MPSLNRVVLLGNVTRDPQLKYLPSQTAVVDAGLAMNRKWKADGGEQREEVTFVDFTCFGKGAEVINQYVHKGDPLLIEGRLKYDTWEDKNGGGKRSKISVVVENFQLMGGKREDAPDKPDKKFNRREPMVQPQGASAAADDDVPFAPNKC